jgi:general secretion pathway protein I
VVSSCVEKHSAAGFTLIEVMVALVIVALGMMAVNSQLNLFVVGAAYIEQKTLASWIATNKVTELSVRDDWPEPGEQEEQTEFAGQLWHVRTEISATPVQNLRRADVHVSLVDAPERVIHTVSGLIEPPPPRGFAPLRWLPPLSGSEG